MKSVRPVPRHPVSEEAVERVTVSLAQSDKTKLERLADECAPAFIEHNGCVVERAGIRKDSKINPPALAENPSPEEALAQGSVIRAGDDPAKRSTFEMEQGMGEILRYAIRVKPQGPRHHMAHIPHQGAGEVGKMASEFHEKPAAVVVFPATALGACDSERHLEVEVESAAELGQRLAHGGEHGVKPQLVRDLKDNAGPLCRLCDGGNFLRSEREWFFAEDVLASLARGDALLRVRLLRAGDDHGVDGVIGKELVQGIEYLRAVLPGQFSSLVRTAVVYSGKPRTALPGDAVRMDAAHESGPDDGELQ